MNSLFIVTLIILGSSLSSPVNNCRCNDPQLSEPELSIDLDTAKAHQKRHNQEVVPDVKIQNSEKLRELSKGESRIQRNPNNEESKIQPQKIQQVRETDHVRQEAQAKPSDENLEYDGEYYADENEELDSSNKRNVDQPSDQSADTYGNYDDSAVYEPVRKKRRDKVWDAWGAWSPCSVSCGTGKSISWRHCKAGGCEPGDKEAKIKICNMNACFY